MQIRTVKLLMPVFVKNVKLIGIVATLLNRSFNVIQRLDDVYLFGKQEIVSTISFLTITTYRNLENIMGNCLLSPQAKINPENYNEWINKYIIIIVIMRKSIEHDTVKRNNMCKRIFLWYIWIVLVFTWLIWMLSLFFQVNMIMCALI